MVGALRKQNKVVIYAPREMLETHTILTSKKKILLYADNDNLYI